MMATYEDSLCQLTMFSSLKTVLFVVNTRRKDDAFWRRCVNSSWKKSNVFFGAAGPSSHVPISCKELNQNLTCF